MELTKKYINNNLLEILEITKDLPDNFFCTNDYDHDNYCFIKDMREEDKQYEMTKKQLISILNQVSQGTPIDLAFRAEGLSKKFVELSKLSQIMKHRPDDYLEELLVYRLIERVWFKSLSKITNNIYQQAIEPSGKNAISAAKLLLEYHEKMESKIKEYDAITNIKK